MLQNKVIVVTGASSGIGQACAENLRAQGAKLMLLARRKDRLETLSKKLDCAYCECDVSNQAQVDHAIAKTFESFGKIDALINNAGIMPLSLFSHRKVADWDRMIDVNIKGVLYTLNACLPELEKSHGHIVNISSVSGHVVLPTAGVYSATKFAIKAISEGLRQEYVGKIRVTNISPGAVSTELSESITVAEIRANSAKFAEIAIDAKEIAEAVCFALSRPQNVSINELIVQPTQQLV